MKVGCMYRWHSPTAATISWSGLLPSFNTGLAAKCLCFLACKYTIHLTTWQHFHKKYLTFVKYLQLFYPFSTEVNRKLLQTLLVCIIDLACKRLQNVRWIIEWIYTTFLDMQGSPLLRFPVYSQQPQRKWAHPAEVLAVMDELGYTPKCVRQRTWAWHHAEPLVSCVLTLPIPHLAEAIIIWNRSCAVMITTLSSAVPVTTWM